MLTIPCAAERPGSTILLCYN